MKASAVLSIFLLLLAAVGCQNFVPNQPDDGSLGAPRPIYPTNNLSDVPINLTFLWSKADLMNKDQLHYSIYLGVSTTKMELIGSGLIDTSFKYQSLEYNTQYYWYIVARNQDGDSSRSEIWSFRTRFKNNHSPYVPSQPQPGNGATAVTLDGCFLQWRGGDPDSFSVVNYDIYLGKSQDAMQLLVSNYPDTSFSLGGLEFSTKYYWKIVAKDHYGAIANGPVWNFTTESAMQLFGDNFDSYPAGGNPDLQKWTINKSGALLFISDSVAYNSGGKSVCFIDTTELGSCFLASRLPARAVGILEFCWMIRSEHDVLGLRMYSQQAQNERLGPQLSIRNGMLQYYDSNYSWQPICEIKNNTWYHIRLAFDCYKKNYKIFVNQRLEKEFGSWTGTEVPDLDLIYFMTFNNRVCSRGFLDQVQFFGGARK